MLDQTIVADFIADSASAFGIKGEPFTPTRAVEEGTPTRSGFGRPAKASGLLAKAGVTSDHLPSEG